MSNTKKKISSGKGLWIAVAAVALLLLAAVLLLLIPEAPETVGSTIQTEEKAQPARVLRRTLQIQEIGEYTGLYVEDGSDEAVTDLLMMVVTNISEEPIQYAEIDLDLGEETAHFSVSVLPAGGTAVLIEQNRMAYSSDIDYAAAEAECVSLAGFDKELSLREDKLKLQLLDGGVNITNISGSDIAETIILCYKNVANGVYHGGIAYRLRLEGGLKAGELRQIMAEHLHDPGSELLFVELVP